MAFKLVQRCDDGTAVLSSGGKTVPGPIQKGQEIFSQGKKAGAITETIGRVESPLYVARVKAEFAKETEFY